jgi:hypothetical protein
MSFTGMHEKAQNQAEGISKRQLAEQTRQTIQALEELTADAAKTARSAAMLTLQATKLAADTIKLTLKIFKHIAAFLKQTAAKTAKSVRAGIDRQTNSFTKSLKEFFVRKPNLGVNIIQEIQGNEQEQAQKFIQLLNTPAGDRAPDGLAGIGIKLGGENLLVVGKDNRVEINLIQPLMESEVIQAAMNENLVPAAIAPDIQPLNGSLASHEADLQALLIANEAIQKAESQLDPEIYRELEALLEQQSEVRSIAEIPVVEIGKDGIVTDPFQEVGAVSEIASLDVETSLFEPASMSSEIKVQAPNSSDLQIGGEPNLTFSQPIAQMERERLQHMESELLTNREFITNVATIDKLHQENSTIRQYGSANRADRVLILTDREVDAAQISVFKAEPTIPEHRAYFIEDADGKELMGFEIKTDGTLAELSIRPTNLAQNHYSATSLVRSIARSKGDKVSNLQIVARMERQPETKMIPAAVTPQLSGELVTIAQLHQVGTPATTLTLPLARKDGSDLEAPVSITQIPQANGETSYEFETQGANPQKFSFTVNPARIVTSFQIDPRQDPRNVRKLIAAAANVATDPDRTDLQPHPDSNLEGIETLQALNTSLRDLNSASQKPVSAAEVTLDDSKFGVKNERDRGVTIVDTATGKTMIVTDNGIEDGGLLKTMMEKAKNGDLLGRKLVAMAQEKANQIKTLVANATPIIMEVVTEGVNRDRDGRVAAKNAVERLGSEIDGLIGAAQQTIAASPASTGAIDRIKQIDSLSLRDAPRTETLRERVETGTERQVAAIVDVLPSSEEPQPETPEQISLQERLNAEIAQNGSQADPKAKAQSQQAQPSL